MSDSGSHVSTDAPALSKLLGLLPGLSIFTLSHPDFQINCQIYNTAHDTKPLAVIRPRTIDDVRVVLKYCSTNGLPMTIRGGGHDLQGRCRMDNGVMVDLRSLNSISMSSDNKSVTIGGGVIQEHLSKYLDDRKLVTPLAWADQVGYVGWATGGGYGMLTPYYGYGVDQILGAQVVTPNGDLIDTDDDEELLWAIRGAGNGNFGAITEMRVKVYPRPNILAGQLVFSASEAPQVLAAFEKMCSAGGDDLPAEACGEGVITTVPGIGMAFFFWFHWVLEGDGSKEKALRHKEKLSMLGTLLADTVEETTPYAFARKQPYLLKEPLKFTAASIGGWTPGMIDLLVKEPLVSGCRILLHQAHGKMLVRNSEAAWANRDRHILLGINGVPEPNGVEEGGPHAVAWAQRFNDKIRSAGLALDKGYWSFTQPEDCDVVGFYGPETAERLRRLKAKYNPGNVFPRAYPDLRGAA